MIELRYDKGVFERQMGNAINLAKRPAGVMAVAGRAGANELRHHFLEKDKTDANKLAPDRRQHLWQQIAHAVQAPVVDQSGRTVTILIEHPVIAQKVFGGDITAKRVTSLTIPESPEAYGRAPAVFERETGLKLIFIKQGDHALLAARVDPNSKELQVEYLLTPRVHQDPDPTALPDQDKLQAAILTAADGALQRQLKEGENQ
jgi:hypothetical protein